MKLTRGDIDFAKGGIEYHLNDAIACLYAHLEGQIPPEGRPPYRVQARYKLNAIGYILSDLKRHLHNDELVDEDEDSEALDTNDTPLLQESE